MEIILKPFSWLLLTFYNFGGYGIALILFGVVIKLVLFPVTLKSKKSMIQTSMLSGRLQQLQVQYGKDRERYNQEVQALYAKEKVNPMGGCVWSLIPMVVLIALYGIIRQPLRYLMDVPNDMIDTMAQITGITNSGAYPQIAMAEALNDPAMLAQAQAQLGAAGDKLFGMNFNFLGLDLAAVPSWNFWSNGLSWASIGLFLLVLVSASVSFLSMKVSTETNKINNQTSNQQMDKTNRNMMLMMPVMSLWIGFTVPAGLSVYWISQYVVTMLQEVICGRILKKDYEAARAAAAEQARLAKEEEKRQKEEARLERARRIEEAKQNKKKKPLQKGDEPEQVGINRDDSREGLRAYARGRSYIPGRYAQVEYADPDGLLRAAAAAPAKKKEKKSDQQAQPAPETVEETQTAIEAAPEAQQVETPAAPAVEAPVQTEETPVEMEEIEVEVEQVEEELPEDDKEDMQP